MNKRITRSTAVALAVICLIYLIHVRFYWHWLEDDTFISMRYAQNLAAGFGLVFNPGERVEGFSNPGWVLLASLGFKLNLDPLLWVRVAAIFAGLATLLLSWQAALLLSPHRRVWALTAPLFLALSPVLSRHTTTGLETVPFAALIAGGFVAAASRPKAIGGRYFVALMLALVIMRPEGIAYALLFLFWRRRKQLTELSSRETTPVTTTGWLEVVSFALISAGLLGLRWVYFGGLFPNTYYVKMTGGSRAFVEGILYTIDFIRENGGGVLVGLLLANLLRMRTGGTAFLLAAIVITTQAVTAIAAGGDWMHFYRFYAPIIPILAAGAAAGLNAIMDLLPANSNRQDSNRTRLVVVVLLGAMAMAYINIYKAERATNRAVLPSVTEGAYLTDGYRQTAQWLVENTAPEATVAICDIGIVGFYSQRPIIDMFGLVDPHISHLNGRTHFKTDSAYVLSRDPDVVVLVAAENGQYLRVPDTDIFANPGFTAAYSLVKTIPVRFRQERIQIYQKP